MDALRIADAFDKRQSHPYDFEHSSLRVRGARRRVFNYETAAEPHFDPRGRSGSKE
jgi:hypothetical protein